MKIDYTDISETRKALAVEIPPDIVEAEIERVAERYGKSAKVPGFRPGKVPPHIVRKKFKDGILHDVAHAMIPRAVNDALRERSIEPLEHPDVTDVVLEEGKPLSFTATFDTLPPIDPGVYEGVSLRRAASVLEVGEVDRTLSNLRQRAARYEPVEDRPSEVGDTLLLDVVRTARAKRLIALPGETLPEEKPESMENVSVEIGSPANPPGFDENLAGLKPGEERHFDTTYPEDFTIEELRGQTVAYRATVKAIRKRVVPALDDELAKELGFDTVDALRARVKEDLQREAELATERQLRADLLKELSGRVSIELPASMVDREIDRRLEEFVGRLFQQGVDPMKAGIDWKQFRDEQKAPAEDTVRAALLLDEIAKRESIAITDEDVRAEIEDYAAQTGREPAAVRAALEKEGGLGRIYAGLRRERTVKWLLEKANITNG
ncbi:MAG TPA: trigger factor [Vicinamibacterales bacterium]|nr:trigger factor [Vicinamibacterales bacterium]